MIIKERFNLLKNLDNIINIDKSELSKYVIDDDVRKLYVVLKLNEKRMSHFALTKILNIIANEKDRIKVVAFSNYSLPVTYNLKTKQIIINLTSFGTDDITPTNPDPKNLFAAVLYGVCFGNIIDKNIKLNINFSATISSYLLTIFIRLFGKEYGLLGLYSSEIIKLNFLINCYILKSFFGIKTSKELYRMASGNSKYNYKNIEELLKNYDFSNIEDFIKSISDLKVMPGLNRYNFTAKILKIIGLNFLPALEDYGRFMSLIAASTVQGSTLIPTFISKYNEGEYKKLVDITTKIVK